MLLLFILLPHFLGSLKQFNIFAFSSHAFSTWCRFVFFLSPSCSWSLNSWIKKLHINDKCHSMMTSMPLTKTKLTVHRSRICIPHTRPSSVCLIFCAFFVKALDLIYISIIYIAYPMTTYIYMMFVCRSSFLSNYPTMWFSNTYYSHVIICVNKITMKILIIRSTCLNEHCLTAERGIFVISIITLHSSSWECVQTERFHKITHIYSSNMIT